MIKSDNFVDKHRTETLLGLERGLATNPPDAASLGAPDLGGLWSDPIIGLSG